MKFYILSIFPEIFDGFIKTSLLKKAIDANFINIEIINFRDFAEPPHYKVDDEPYGGGAGMVLKPEPIITAVNKIKLTNPNAKTILLSASGISFNQSLANTWSNDSNDFILICGRYEGVDERVKELVVDYEISVGDYVLFGGEVPAMIVIEAITRLKEQVLGNSASLQQESFSLQNEGLLEAPQYTRPKEFEGLEVPKVLLSGDHQEITVWRKNQAYKKTLQMRPDLIKNKS